MMQSWACRFSWSDNETIINSTSRGKAKREFLLDCDLDGVKYTDVRTRCCGGPVTTDGLRRTAEYRGVPFARAGMRVKVGDSHGRISGHNSSANFDVLFDDGPNAGLTLNCHPRWEITYFDDDGQVIFDCRERAEA